MVAIVTSIKVGNLKVDSYKVAPLTGHVLIENFSSNGVILERDI